MTALFDPNNRLFGLARQQGRIPSAPATIAVALVLMLLLIAVQTVARQAIRLVGVFTGVRAAHADTRI